MRPDRARAAESGRGLGCQPPAEEEAAVRVRLEGRDLEVCGGSGSRGRAMRERRGVRPPGSVVVVATVVLLLSGVGPARGSEDIVVGCGGFVKSDVEINYSLIEVSARPAARSSLCDPGPIAQPLGAAVASPLTPGSCHQPPTLGVLSFLKAPLSAGLHYLLPSRAGVGVLILGSATESGWDRGPEGMCTWV